MPVQSNPVPAPTEPATHPMAAHPAPNKRPFGLKAIMVLLVLQAAGSVIAALFFWFANQEQYRDLMGDLGDLQVVPFAEIFYLISGLFRLVVLVGIWRMQRWAWFLMMAMLAVSMAVDIVAFFHGEPHYWFMVLNVAMVFYLNQADVQSLFVTRERGGQS